MSAGPGSGLPLAGRRSGCSWGPRWRWSCRRWDLAAVGRTDSFVWRILDVAALGQPPQRLSAECRKSAFDRFRALGGESAVGGNSALGAKPAVRAGEAFGRKSSVTRRPAFAGSVAGLPRLETLRRCWYATGHGNRRRCRRRRCGRVSAKSPEPRPVAGRNATRNAARYRRAAGYRRAARYWRAARYRRASRPATGGPGQQPARSDRQSAEVAAASSAAA